MHHRVSLHYRALQARRQQWQAVLYIGLLIVLTALLMQPILTSSAFSLAASFFILAALVGWTQWRLNKALWRLKRLEHQVHRLSAQQATSSKPKAQPISHLDAEHFFTRNQTRH